MASNEADATALLSEMFTNAGGVDIDTLTSLFARLDKAQPPLGREAEKPTDLDHYEGQTKNGKAHGSGEIIWADGRKYKGEFFEGKPQGKGVLTYANGDKFTGELVNGKRDGLGLYEWENGDKYFGEWKRGKMNGRGGVMRSVFASIGHYRGGKLCGEGKKMYANGSKYEGQYKNGLFDGIGKMVWHDGSQFDGGWKKGMRHGEGIYTSADGTKKKGVWKDGMLQITQEVDESDTVEIIGSLSREDIVAQNVKTAEAKGEVIEIL